MNTLRMAFAATCAAMVISALPTGGNAGARWAEMLAFPPFLLRENPVGGPVQPALARGISSSRMKFEITRR